MHQWKIAFILFGRFKIFPFLRKFTKTLKDVKETNSYKDGRTTETYASITINHKLDFQRYKQFRFFPKVWGLNV